jgi:hypothetical protein
MVDAVKLLCYIRDSPKRCLWFTCVPIKPVITTDASHGTHGDGTGHGCMMVSLGSSPIFYNSTKIKMIVLSSTEAEHYVLCNAAKIAKWLISVLGEIGYKTIKPVKMYQDNTSAIWMTYNEGSFARTAHLLIRRNYVKEAVTEGNVIVEHIATEMNTADMGTKPLTGDHINRFLTKLMVMSGADMRNYVETHDMRYPNGYRERRYSDVRNV